MTPMGHIEAFRLEGGCRNYMLAYSTEARCQQHLLRRAKFSDKFPIRAVFCFCYWKLEQLRQKKEKIGILYFRFASKI